MEIIKKLSEMIEEELHDAEKYAKCALAHKEDRPALAVTFDLLSRQEMDHMNALHKQVVSIIEEYRKEEGEPPVNMMAIYDWEHGKQIDHAVKVKMLQSMYREG